MENLWYGSNGEFGELSTGCQSVIYEILHGINLQQIQAKNWMIVRIENFAAYATITPKSIICYN